VHRTIACTPSSRRSGPVSGPSQWTIALVFSPTILHRGDRSDTHHKRQAAVLILLYEKGGDLRVLLTTRSKNLRAHPGQTALPGGKMDDTDADAIVTAVSPAAVHMTRLLKQYSIEKPMKKLGFQ
jgi:hypothetical protein